MTDAIPTITQIALDLHTDLMTIKTYGTKAPPVTRALIAEADAKLIAISEHLECVRRSLIAVEAPPVAA